ncbi:hypothetical protein D3C81_2226550 [compost metagenome]
MNGRARVLGQGRGVEFLERLNGAGIAQLECFIRAQVFGLGDTGGHCKGGGSDKGSHGFHRESPLRSACLRDSAYRVHLNSS